jgi:hypothetical protein
MAKSFFNLREAFGQPEVDMAKVAKLIAPTDDRNEAVALVAKEFSIPNTKAAEYVDEVMKQMDAPEEEPKDKEVKESNTFFQIREGKNHPAADELNDYAKKHGGIDKKDFQVAAGKLNNYKATGNPGTVADLIKMLKDLDTDPMEKILVTIKKHDKAMAKTLERKMGISIKESVELDESNADMYKWGDINTALMKAGIRPPTIMKVVSALRGKEIKEEVELAEAAPKISTGKAKGNITATGLRGKGMKKFDVSVKVVNGKFEFRITDESGKFQTVGLKKAASMLGESFDLAEAPEDNEPASPDEKSMAMDQAKFIKYVGDEIMEYLNKNKEFPEWMQNKLSGLHEKAKGLHATMAGKYNESLEIDEALEVKLRGGKVPVGQHKLIYKTSKTAKYIENSLKARDKDAEVTQKGDEVHATASAQAHSALIASLRKFREDGLVTEGNMGRDEKSRAKNDANRLANNKIVAKHKFANQKPKKEEAELDEAAKFTDKQIKMAYGIINDPRYKGGNMTAVVKKIEQIAKGLSKHAGVVKALRVTNESVEEQLDERSPWGDLKVKFHKTFNKNYEKALKWMKDTGKSAADAERMFAGTDARELDKMATAMESTAAYGKSVNKIMNDRKKANMKPGELDKLAKIRAMLDKEKKKK